MEKTTNFNLNKPEVTDPLRVEDFNENADIMDAALGNLNTAVAGGMKFQSGTYVGTGTYGEKNPVTLSFDFQPKFVMIWCDFLPQLLFALPNGKVSIRYDNNAWSSPTTWSDRSLSWYDATAAKSQMNEASKNYYYVALG